MELLRHVPLLHGGGGHAGRPRVGGPRHRIRGEQEEDQAHVLDSGTTRNRVTFIIYLFIYDALYDTHGITQNTDTFSQYLTCMNPFLEETP